jgi:epoxyqueuosine reductase QueG
MQFAICYINENTKGKGILTMTYSSHSLTAWLTSFMKEQKILIWGVADLREFSTPKDAIGQGFPIAISWAIPMNPGIMAGIQHGPNQAYADEYSRVNALINEQAEMLVAEIRGRDFRAQLLASSERTDTVFVKGDFPHKTAATRAGLGWIGRHCQLITRAFGSWIRLGTVFTDMELPCGTPAVREFCGRCTRCVEACPAGALTGNVWYPGLPREDILDVRACDHWKKEHFFMYHRGHNCGICSSVCPYGLKVLKRELKL